MNSINFVPASVSDRVYALIIDVFGVVIPLIYGLPIVALYVGLGALPWMLYAIIIVFAIFVYEPLMVSTYGQTLGHRLMRIKVQDNQGNLLSIGNAFLRFVAKSLLGVFSFFTLIYSSQTIHDMASNSFVVKLRPSDEGKDFERAAS